VSPAAIVIGAGVDELVAAHYLRRAGHRVVVFNEHRVAGARAVDIGGILPRIVRDLALRGVTIDRRDPWATVALPDGGLLGLWHDMARSTETIRKISPKDGSRWPVFCDQMNRLAGWLQAVYSAAPPDPTSRAFGDIAGIAGLALRARGLGRENLESLLRLIPMSVADLLDEWFENDALKGVLGAAGILNLAQGPRSGGTAFNFLHHHVGSPCGVFRPPRSNLGRVLRELPGIEIRDDEKVARILVDARRVVGVALESGEEVSAPVVVSGIHPRRTLLELLEWGWLDPHIARALENVRSRGVTARITIILDRPVDFTHMVAPSLDYLERAYDDAKYGHVSRAPYIEAHAGTGADGRHRIDVHLQYAPYALADGEWDERRCTELAQVAVSALTRYEPHLEASALERHVLSPRALEELHGYPEGQPYHAELGLDQMLWARPLRELARYGTPIGGLYLCGPALHPGGGMAGASGANAASVILRDLQRIE
jgi:phytoene dehydrogenase-like protein